MMMSKEQILDTKARLAEAVARKKALTQQRLALKRVPFKTRTADEHTLLLALIGLGREQKETVRVVQLAYAFARGRPYWSQERRMAAGGTLGRLAGLIERILPVRGDEVLAWMMTPVDDMARLAFAAHEQAAREAAHVERQARAKARPAQAQAAE